MDGTKMPWRSLTVVSALASALVALLGLAGIVIDGEAATRAVEAGGQIVSAAAALLAVYGRVRATARIERR